MDTNIEPILENLVIATVESGKDTASLLEANVQATMNVKEAIESTAKNLPVLKIEIEGSEVAQLEGKTPQKGVDYLTDEDIQEIAQRVADILKNK